MQTKLQIRSLVQEIAGLAKQDLSVRDFYAAFLERLVQALAAVGGAVWAVGEGGSLELQYQINLRETRLTENQQHLQRHGMLLQKSLASAEGSLITPHSGEGDDNQPGNPTDYLLVLGPIKVDQEARQDLSALPTLELNDIPMKFEDIPSRDARAAAAAIEFFPQPTNGITYLDIRCDFAALSPEEKELLPLFSRVLTQSGAAGQDYVEIAERIAAVTGGVGAAPQIQSLAAQEDYLQSFVLSGRALDRNARPFVDLLTDLMARLEIEPKRLKDVIAEMATRLESSIAGLGFQFAILRAHSKLTSEGAINDRLQGIGMLHVMRRLAKIEEKDLGDLIKRLAAIRTRLFQTGSVRFVVTCEDGMVETLQPLLAGLVAALPEGAPTGVAEKPKPLEDAPEARTAPVPVAFNVRIFKTVRYTNPDAPALLVLANYVRDTFLHRELREKGGAYGGYAQAGIGSGTFYFGSYRDPNIVRTYDVYTQAVTWVTDSEIDPEALKEAILGACGDVDPLESPDIKGRREATNRLTGFTREARERFKQRLLEVTADDLRRVARAHLTVAHPAQATVAGPELVEAARKERPDLFGVVAPI